MKRNMRLFLFLAYIISNASAFARSGFSRNSYLQINHLNFHSKRSPIYLTAKDSSTKSSANNDDLCSWLELVFPGRKIRKVFHAGTFDKTEGSIIPNPKIDMDIPLLNYDISKDINKIYEELSKPPSPALKHVIAIVQGQGGGKSRIFEEIRRKLLDDFTLLPIAITCNSDSPIGYDELQWLNNYDSQNGCLSTFYVMSIISRMIFALYEFDEFRSVTKEITKNIQYFPEKLSYYSVIREFLKVVVNDVSPVRNVTDVVVIFDDSHLLARHYKYDDIHGLLRAGLLNDQIGNLRCTLLMSSLDTAQIGNKEFRGISELHVPEKLDEHEIVEKLFNKMKEKVNKTSQYKLKLIASLVSNIPRTVQFAMNYIVHYNIKNKLNSIDAAFVKNIFEYLLDEIEKSYTPFLPSVEMMYKLVYDIDIPTIEETKRLIEQSILTNNNFDSFNTNWILFSPKVSLLMLASAARQTTAKNVLAPYITSTFDDILTGITNTKKDGDILENIFAVWLQLRLQCAYELGCIDKTASLTVGQLLGSSYLSNIEGIWDQPIVFPSNYNCSDTVVTMKRLSFIVPHNHATTTEGSDEYFQDWMNKLVSTASVTSSNPIRIVKLAKGEREADHCLVIYREGGGGGGIRVEGLQPLFIFLKMKSRKVSNTNVMKKIINSNSSLGSVLDADDAEKLIGSSDSESIVKMLKKFSEHDFAFVYFSTKSDVNCIYDNGAINLGTQSVERFFFSYQFTLSCRKSVIEIVLH